MSNLPVTRTTSGMGDRLREGWREVEAGQDSARASAGEREIEREEEGEKERERERSTGWVAVSRRTKGVADAWFHAQLIARCSPR